MRNYASGKTRARWRVWAVCLLALSWAYAPDAVASPIRRSWLFEQISRLAPPTAADQSRYSLTLDGATYGRDAFSSLVSATLDFRVFELRILGSRRYFFDPSSQYAMKLGGPPADSQDPAKPIGERDTIGLEVARYHSLSKRHFGRLGIGALKFFPDKTRWIYFSLSTGILARPDVPWDFRLGLVYYYGRIDRSWAVITAGAEIMRELSAGLKTGFAFRWSYTTVGAYTNELRDTTVPSWIVLEHMGFSLAPELDYRFSMGNLRLAVPLRLYVDRDLTRSEAKPATGPTDYPAEFPVPSVEMSFSVVF